MAGNPFCGIRPGPVTGTPAKPARILGGGPSAGWPDYPGWRREIAAWIVGCRSPFPQHSLRAQQPAAGTHRRRHCRPESRRLRWRGNRNPAGAASRRTGRSRAGCPGHSGLDAENTGSGGRPMKLQSLRVEQLRQFRQPFALEHLQPGLNLIHGPNESGKSTLVRAIRAAFFERYRSQAVDDLRPWGDSAAAPTIELAFEHQGRQWRLIKSFLKRTRCNLVVGTEAWSEDEAEEKLAELLGYQYPKRGASKAEFWGIPGLLWVEQGTGQDLEQAVEHAGDHLKSALNALVGEVASSGGDAVIEAVKSRRDTLLTATGQPRGDYKALQQEQVELQAQVKALDERVQRYQEQVDRLSRLVQEFEQAEQDKPWEAAAQQLEQAREQLTRAEQLEHQQEQDRGTLARLVQHQDLLEQALAQSQRLDEQKAARQAELERLRQQR